ncbi:MAG: hypothetical protein IJE59_01305 [Clostridia bacterium]|nr:hypothetical protein [Clostridia bacterium]
MSDNKKTQSEDLKKLEDEAYYELCQIIAEAMQYQDVGLLDSRIAAWKNKYKKLLDNSPSNSNFKKRVEFLLTQYYSEITQYILKQLKLKEEKKVENQSKALRQLYSIIRDTNDLDLLKKKVKQWQDKYPVSGFLKMYQKRIEYYTREKNLRENAFEQEKAFRDLVDITKVHGTLDELKNELALWEEKYSINNKYTIDDFIKHQSEVKRFTSDEFLQSIAREENDNTDKNDIDIVEEYNNKSCSALSLQTTAYSALLSIAGKSNNVSELFDWVYKNRYIKFNDKYKELILSATYLNYRPQYLNSLTIPDIDISKSSLSFDEYKNIDEIKRYAIISYFNLLLPPDKAISNDYFNKHIQTIYSKSEKARNSIDIKDQLNPIEDTFDSGIEILLENADKPSNSFETDSEQQSVKKVIVEDTLVEEDSNVPELIIDLSDTESGLTINLENTEKDTEFKIELEDFSKSTDELMEIKSTEDVDSIDKTQEKPVVEELKSNLFFDNNQEREQIEVINDTSDSIDQHCKEEYIVEATKKEDPEKALNHETIVAFSPLFFETINNYNKQSVLVRYIDSTTNKYLESEKTNDISLNESVKAKTDEY